MTADGGVLPGIDDTIAAIATPPGRGAIALVRVSGRHSIEIARRIVSPWPSIERRPSLCDLRHPESGVRLDRALVTVYADGRSFTGEPMVEISTHGGLLVPSTVLDALLAAGARPALPGEFTRRAVLHGRMDLLQAEAIGDLIDARSGSGQRVALRQLDGGLSERVLALRDRIIEIEALIAYEIDFPEEDDGPVPAERIRAACADTLAALDGLLATAPAGELVRTGALVVLAGAPNAGKSSLFNALLGESRAIVTDVPGTTRDALEAVIDADPWPLRLVDTAGLRSAADVVERLGVEVSERYLGAADLILACAETEEQLADTVARIRRASAGPVLGVLTKRDLATLREAADRDASSGGRDAVPASGDVDDADGVSRVGVSARTGEGLHELVDAIGRLLAAAGGGVTIDAPLLTRERHRRAVANARAELARFHELHVSGEVPAAIASVHLHTATLALEELIGAVDVEDVLDRVFASFCIGK